MNQSEVFESGVPQKFIWTTGEIARFVLLLAASCVIIVCNTIIIVLIAKYRKLQTWTNCLLLSLAVADLLVGLLSVPTHLVADLNVFGGNEHLCIALNTPAVIVPIASIFSLIAASIERLLAIIYPLRYPDWVSRKRILITIAFIWIYSLGLGALPVLGWNNIDDRQIVNATFRDCNFAAVMSGQYTGLCVAGNILPGMVFLLCLNAKLFIVVRYQRKRFLISCPGQRTGSVSTLNDDSVSLPNRERKQIQKSRRVVFILLGLCHMTVLSYVPLTVAFIIDYQWFTVTWITDWVAPYALYSVGVLLAALNSITNPIVLGFANREIRKHLKIIRCRLSSNPHQVISISLVNKCVR